MRVLLFSILILISTSSSASVDDSTQALLSACQSVVDAKPSGDYFQVPPTFDAGYCYGAFSAIQNAITLAFEGEQPIFGVCAPPESNLKQIIIIFNEYAEKNPQILHEGYFLIAIESLRDAFPCE